MQEPAMRSGGSILAVARSEDPVALASVVLDPKIVPYGRQLGVALPPFAKDALPPIRALYATANSAPGKGDGWMIGQQGDGLDWLGRRQQARWAWPVPRPGRAHLRRHRRDSAHAPFRDVAHDRGRPIEPVLADPVGEYVDEIGDIRHTIFDQPRRELLGVEGFGERRRERQDFDPEPWLNRLDLFAQQPGQTFDVTDWQRRTDADSLCAVVDTKADEVEAARAEALCLERRAEPDDELANVACDGLGRRDGFGEAAANLDQFGGA